MRFPLGLLALLSVAVMLTGCVGGGGGVGGIVSAQAVIRGSVLDANGNPVMGAEVSTFVKDQIVRTTSGRDGSFELRFLFGEPRLVVTVTARKDNQSTSAVVAVTPGTEVTVTLRFTSSGAGGGIGAETPPPPPF
jgi:hypothetical protein